MAEQLRRVAGEAHVGVGLTAEQSPAELLRAIVLDLAARTPNEPDDNPQNPAAGSLRSTLQSGYSAERG